ncbi:MAG TPA: ATP-dependent helicase HrpB [Polyangiaceae bacterium]|nr:ATP-dependent helicase HrpB [Polyangiaceae bacterium]
MLIRPPVRALPIDPLLPEICEKTLAERVLVLEAEPGAGKTTRVPLALHRAGLTTEGVIVVAEPRRLAARLAAEYVSRELGERVGGTVGYSVRFEEETSRDTRIVYATEGVLMRRLLQDPELGSVSAVVLDEFHERHLATDVLLALVDRLRRTTRPKLALVVMSATLDAGPLAEHLGAKRVRSEGRAFPLTIEHQTRPDDRPVERQVASAVRKLLAEEATGDVLVFLPGAREIRMASEALSGERTPENVLVLPLHGDLPMKDQARAVEPARERKVILSTNVAESSVTIDGVTAVVDTGLARVAGHSPWSGLPTLATAKISRASAVQRAGRAGRTRPGRVIRLYTEGDLATRDAHDKPEILRDDLSETFLGLHGMGVRNPAELRWLAPPPPAAAEAADALLRRLGALAPDGALSPTGRRMLAFPVSPRLARVLVEGERRGVAADTCVAVALLSERDIRTGVRTAFQGGRPGIDASGPSDVLELMERFHEAEGEDFHPRRLGSMGLDGRAVQAVDRVRRQLARIARDSGPRPDSIDGVDEAIQIALLAGFPDRIAKRRSKTDRSLSLWSGKSARLLETSVVHDAPLVVALDAEESRGTVVVRLASAMRLDWLFELYPEAVEMSEELAWNPTTEAVDRVSRISSGSVVLEEERSPAKPSEEVSRVLVEAALAKSPPLVQADEKLSALRERLELLRREVPEADLPDLGAGVVNAAVERAAAGRTRLSELRGVDLGDELLSGLGYAERALLEKEAPVHLTLPGGRTVPVHYDPGKPPWVESRLQDFFGMSRTPTVAKGRVPLTVHLLAPNQRAVQVTTDLAGFWERHYPGIRKELCRRYPRHSWPEDGATAVPPPPKRR